jgi:hypothetical protein
MDKLPPIITSCGRCVFATYEDNTQVGCHFNRLQKYEKFLKGAYDETGKKFFIIEGRYCPFLRNSEWRDKVKLAGENIYGRVKSETTLNYMGVILTNKTTTREELGKTLDSLLGQDIKPSHITVCVYTGGILNQFNSSKLLKNRGVEWKVQFMTEDYARGFVIDLAIDSTKRPWYVVVECNNELIKGAALTWQDTIIEHSIRGAVIKGKNYDLYNTSCHQYFGGNFEKPLEDKLQEEGFGDLIISDIVPCVM